jgi:hypothetical protein
MTVLPQLKQNVRDAAAAHLPAPDHEPARSRRRPHARRRPLRAIGASLPIVLSVGVAIVIAAGALIAIRHGNSSHPAARDRPVASSRQELVQALGVLRTRQTKSDLDPVFGPGFFRLTSLLGKRWGYPKLDRALVRVVHLPAWQAKAAFEPATFQPSPSSSRRVEGLELNLWIGSARTIPPSSDTGTGPQPASVDTVLAHGLAITDGNPGKKLVDCVVAVPDGVARITLTPIRLTHSPVSVNPSRFGTATATVRDNIAAFQLPIPTVANRHALTGEFGVPAVAQAVWFDASGNVVKRTTTTLDLFITVSGEGPLPAAAGTHLRQNESGPVGPIGGRRAATRARLLRQEERTGS